MVFGRLSAIGLELALQGQGFSLLLPAVGALIGAINVLANRIFMTFSLARLGCGCQPDSLGL